MKWDPQQYLRFADERSRPFFDLVARVGAGATRRRRRPGLRPRQPDRDPGRAMAARRVLGFDSSPEMIERGPRATHRTGCVRGGRRDLAGARPRRSTCWSPTPLCSGSPATDCSRRLVAGAGPGGWLAFQVPGNFGAPSHTGCATWPTRRAGDLLHAVDRATVVVDPRPTTSAAGRAGAAVDAWETTYVHVLAGADPCWRWMSGTGLRPVLDALPREADRDGVRRPSTGAALREAYPPRRSATLLPFRRIFAVAQMRGVSQAGGRSAGSCAARCPGEVPRRRCGASTAAFSA